MATTKNGIYYPGDYNAKADIPTDLKKMAESIDKNVQDNKYNDEPIKQDIQELQTDVSDIKAEQEVQNDLLERTQNALINITTEKSSNINVKDSSDLNAKIDVYGSSSQKTRSGKNKFDIEKLTGANITDKDSTTGTFTMTNCWATTIMNNDSLQEILKPNTQYKCIADVTLSSKPNDLSSVNNHGDVLALFNSSTNTVYKILSVSSADEKNSWEVNATKSLNKTFTTPADLTGFVMIGYNYRTERLTIEGSFKIKNAMILEATENDESFEQYGASPSPKYPSEIENTGDNINLFNKEAVESGKYIEASTGEVKSSGETSASDYINIKDIKELILSGDDIVRTNGGAFYSSEKVYISGFTTTQIWSGIDIPETANYVRVTVTTANLDKIKLEKGKKATSYSSYKCGSIDITVCNKNLFTGFTKGKGLNDTTGEETTNSTGAVSNFIEVGFSKNSNYYLSGLTNTLNSYIAAYNKNKEFLGRIGANAQTNISFNKDSFTLYSAEGDIAFVRVTQYEITTSTGTIDDIDDLNVQLEANNVATDFIAHEEQLITFPLSEGQRLADGDYLASDGIHHVRKQTALPNATSLSEANLFGVNCKLAYYTLAGSKSSGREYNFLSDKIAPANEAFGQYKGYKNGKTINIMTTLDDTLENFNSKIAGSIVEYELAEEEIEAYTEEQQEAYNKLQNVLSYKPVTNVFTDKAQLVFKYIADTKTYVDNQYNGLAQQILEIVGGK